MLILMFGCQDWYKDFSEEEITIFPCSISSIRIFPVQPSQHLKGKSFTADGFLQHRPDEEASDIILSNHIISNHHSKSRVTRQVQSITMSNHDRLRRLLNNNNTGINLQMVSSISSFTTKGLRLLVLIT